jgi:hypothetical protein
MAVSPNRSRILAAAVLVLTVPAASAAAPPALLDQGYQNLYNLNFNEAHRAFAGWEKDHPEDPMGTVSDAAAYLFAEFDRLHVLESEFFTEDAAFLTREATLAPDPAAKRSFEAALDRARSLASTALMRNAEDENAMLATVLTLGLHSDYLFLIEKRNLAALTEAKQARRMAERLLAVHPDCYDAYLAVGIENYLLSLKPLPVRWMLRLGGGQTNKRTGVNSLRITAEKGHYLRPYARLLLAVAVLRDRDVPTARQNLASLAGEFPNNQLYRRELSRLNQGVSRPGVR